MIDEKRIAEIEGRLSKATPGPWEVLKHEHEDSLWCTITADVMTGLDVCYDLDAESNLSNAEFVKNAPADTRYLLDLVKEMREELSRERMKSRDLERKVRV